MDHSAMRVNTDGVLLGAWCQVDGARRVLDVGTGCGVIALQVAQRNAEAQVLAIDIDEGAVTDATQNFAASAWSARLEARLADFNELALGEKEAFDLIVSNPPYFSDGVLPPEQSRRMARHGVTLNYAQLMSGAKRLLSATGILAMVTPTEAQREVVEQCAWAGMGIKRMTEVSSVAGRPPKRLLWEIIPGECPLQRSQLAIETAEHNFTQEYLDLCQSFYLKM